MINLMVINSLVMTILLRKQEMEMAIKVRIHKV